jgi:hypothetical protein
MPYVAGAVVGVLAFMGIVVCAIWFPWIGEPQNKWWRDFAFFTTFLFFILISRNWRFHKRFQFWAAVAVLAAAHTTGVLLFISHVHLLTILAYAVLLFFEIIVGDVFLRRLLHDGERKKDRVNADSTQ